ncbi:hypothetical protein BZG36_04011 [Bifiguratus adelaidae]|uniref:Heat shock protein 75 kDa, mitochondrial n=1 Tax=Bifiguratus adelaidae TaxID=1938954 RepID=A0A261XYF1_9FUNG|nr:hypothetical protein BZG36_04011 [Bifiguratus adelaidae]
MFRIQRVIRSAVRVNGGFRVYASPTVYKAGGIGIQHLSRTLTTEAASNTDSAGEGQNATKENVIQETETVKGHVQTHEFKTETKKLLNIVANSLYSEKEIFVRELVSNAADALEKLRHLQSGGTALSTDHPLEIHISVDQAKNQFIIQDFGVGMTEEEVNENLGTIARSGSKSFLEKLEKEEAGAGSSKDKIIGQFGVGFYSTFMVGNKIKVYTKSATPGSKGYCWTTDGHGSYTLAEADGVSVGTKIVIELKDECKSYANKIEVDSIIKKYSNFVGFPIYLNGQKVNTVDALWTKDKSAVTPEQHKEFYRFVANAFDDPQFTLHYKTDAPLNISAILYIPERHMEILGQHIEPGVNLYSRKVLIQPKSRGLFPEWLRFLKGVVDSEDIPLNVSRELMQDNILSKLKHVMTRRVIKWLEDESKKNTAQFNEFFLDYGQFIKEGVCTDSMNKKEIAKLLRYESSATKSGELIGLKDYADRVKEGQKRIYYILAPKRKFAEESPYNEVFRQNGVEVLYLYDTVDEFVVNHLREFQGLQLVSVDSAETANDPLLKKGEPATDTAGKLTDQQAKDLAAWMELTLGRDLVSKVDVSRRLVSYPAIVTDHESPAMRKMMAMMQGSAKQGEMPLQPNRLEINPDHKVMQGLYHTKDTNPTLARMAAEQVYDNALCAAGVLDDPRSMISRLNSLLEISLGIQGKTVEESKKVPVVEGEKA